MMQLLNGVNYHEPCILLQMLLKPCILAFIEFVTSYVSPFTNFNFCWEMQQLLMYVCRNNYWPASLRESSVARGMMMKDNIIAVTTQMIWCIFLIIVKIHELICSSVSFGCGFFCLSRSLNTDCLLGDACHWCSGQIICAEQIHVWHCQLISVRCCYHLLSVCSDNVMLFWHRKSSTGDEGVAGCAQLVVCCSC